MPYSAGNRLPGERASRLGHLDVLKSELVNQLCKSFENPNIDTPAPSVIWEPIPSAQPPLSLVFGIDGSMQPVRSETRPYKELAFIKTAMLKIDRPELAKVDREHPHPFALRDIMKKSGCYHATVLPLKNVSIPEMSLYDGVRQVIFESVKDASLEAEPMETLKWLAYEKWDGRQKQLPLFGCPHCEETVATLPYDAEEGNCPSCGGHLFLTDMLGFHLEMAPDMAPQTIAMSYMTIHETLLLFTGIRYYWQEHPKVLSRCLFVKDGPLSIRAQYSKLVNPIRRFLAHARALDCPIYIIGQEKSGAFYDHLQLIGKDAPDGSLFIPDGNYISSEVYHRPNPKHPYGRDTNYGAKVFVKLNKYHQMVLNITTGEYVENPQLENLIGAAGIFATLPEIISYRYEGALLPVELAHGIASLSSYPSARILKMFADETSNNLN